MLHWLTILLENREFDTSAPLAAEAKEYLMNTFHLDYKSADIIIGYRADDSYFSFASDFINGAISYRQLCNAMRLGKLGQQFVLKSKAAFEQLEFLGYETADSKEYDLKLKTPMVLHADGEYCGDVTEMHFQCLPKKLHVMW